MATYEVSTPSPPGSVHTPPTPKHGYSDAWEPFSPRKSARISSQRAYASTRTPSPRSSARSHLRSPNTTKTTQSHIFSTPAPTPQKKRLATMDNSRRASGSLTAESTATAADSLRISQRPSANSAARRGGMLPTPAKTPRKNSYDNKSPDISAVARNLFSAQDDALPSLRRKRAKKYTGLTMESFIAQDMDDSITIFTDSRDRVPVVDRSDDNPFYGESATIKSVPEPTKHRNKRKQVVIPGEGKQDVDEVVRREDGIVYVFRGKKIFRKFSDNQEAEPADSSVEQEDDAITLNEAGSETQPRKHITRSSIKPRLLFPPEQSDSHGEADGTDEEEALTDIEEPTLGAVTISREEFETPQGFKGDTPATPAAPRFAPASPPTTERTTRQGSKVKIEDYPMKNGPAKARSPFDVWRRSRSSATHGQKREGDSLSQGLSTAAKRHKT